MSEVAFSGQDPNKKDALTYALIVAENVDGSDGDAYLSATPHSFLDKTDEAETLGARLGSRLQRSGQRAAAAAAFLLGLPELVVQSLFGPELMRNSDDTKAPAVARLSGRRPVSVVAAMRPLLALDELAAVTLCGVTFWDSVAPRNPALTSGRILILAMLSAMLTITYRQLSAPRSASAAEGVVRGAVRVALSAMAAGCTVVLFCAVLLPDASQAGLGIWAAGWVLSITLATGVLEYVVGSAVAQAGFATVRAAMVCSAERVGILDQAAACMRGWHWMHFPQSSQDDDLTALAALAQRGGVDVVVLDSLTMMDPLAGRVCDLLAEFPVRVCLAFEPTSVDLLAQHEGLILADLTTNPLPPSQAAIKRGLDILLSSFGLLITMPVFLISAATISLETKGSPIFRQWRFGLGGHPFQMLKFRTMHVEASDKTGEKATLRNDPRVTRVGKVLRRTSIDELPQLFNVLRGDMSLVGPRAHPVNMKVEGINYADAVRKYRIRHRIRPGITGWAQVNGSRGLVDSMPRARRRVELDLFYLSHCSVLLDLEIIARTILGGFIAGRD